MVYEGEDVVPPKKRDVLVLTNFRIAESGSGPVSCVRYNAATRMLAAEQQPTVESVRDVLAATASSTGSRTQYSTVFDLKKKEIYVYHFHNFREVRRFRLQDETEKGDRSLAISSLFPTNHEFQEYHRKFDESLEKQQEDRSVAANVAKGTKDFIVNYDTNGDSKLDLDELGPTAAPSGKWMSPRSGPSTAMAMVSLMGTDSSTSVWRSARLSCSAVSLFLDWILGPSRSLDLARPSCDALMSSKISLSSVNESGMATPGARLRITRHLRAWTHALVIGQPLPLLPLWLADNLAVPLELEAT